MGCSVDKKVELYILCIIIHNIKIIDEIVFSLYVLKNLFFKLIRKYIDQCSQFEYYQISRIFHSIFIYCNRDIYELNIKTRCR